MRTQLFANAVHGNRQVMVAADGSFAADGLPAGKLLLLARCQLEGRYWGWPLTELDLLPGTDMDLGELELPAIGQVEIAIPLAGASAAVRASVRTEAGTVVASLVIEPGRSVTLYLPEGRYAAAYADAAAVTRTHEFVVASSATTRVRIPRTAGRHCRVVVVPPFMSEGAGYVPGALRAEGGREECELRLRPSSRTMMWEQEIDLLPGTYSMAARFGSKTVRGTLIVRDDSNVQVFPFPLQ